MNHLLKRGGDESGDADQIAVLLFGRSQNLFGGNHHSEVNNLIAIALHHHANNILSYIVNIAFGRCHQQLPLSGHAFSALVLGKVWVEIGNRPFHHPC